MMYTKRYIPDTVCHELRGHFDAESTCHTLGSVHGGYFGRVSNNAFWTESEIPTLTELNCESNSANVSVCEYSGWGRCGNHYHNLLLTCYESG